MVLCASTGAAIRVVASSATVILLNMLFFLGLRFGLFSERDCCETWIGQVLIDQVPINRDASMHPAR
jgi:hypothetical protein